MTPNITNRTESFSITIRFLFVSGITMAIVAGTNGCGHSNAYGTKQITGRVVYEDGTPVPGRLGIRFQSLNEPIDARTHPRPAYAFTNDQGEFEYATTYQHADGVIQGKHRVTIGEMSDPGSLVDPKYGDPKNSPLEVDSSDSPFELIVSRPAERKS